MQFSSLPARFLVPFANAGTKNTIPVESQVSVTPGAASLEDGFPPLTRTPKEAGGIPPFGQDFNGIFFWTTDVARAYQSGVIYPYNTDFAAAIGGYPQNAIVSRADGTGFWVNTVNDNQNDPDAGGTGWVPMFNVGATSKTGTSSDITLTALEYSKPLILVTGALTADISLIFPAHTGQQWIVSNGTSGDHTVTFRTDAGSGVVIDQGNANTIFCDGTDIDQVGPALPDFPVGEIIGDIDVQDLKRKKVFSAIEPFAVIDAAAGGTIHISALEAACQYFTQDATANWTFNVQGDDTTDLNDIMDIGTSITVTLMATQGSTAYYNNIVQVDGNTITPIWMFGLVSSAGNPNSVDMYNYVIVKTADATFTVFASQTQWA